MTQIFNTPFEISMRALIIVSLSQGLTLDRINAYDFLATYGRRYGISDFDLNGDCDASQMQIDIRRQLMKDSLKELVLKRYICVEKSENGFIYKATALGTSVVGQMESDYSKEFISYIAVIDKRFSNLKESELIRLITKPNGGK